MSIKAVLFDLDGTLLPMDQDEFVKKYFGMLAAKMAGHGYEPKELVEIIWVGTKAMVKNDGSRSNEEAFWDSFTAHYGEKVRADIPLFDEFYQKEFDDVKESCGYNPKAAETVAKIKSMGYRVALATNPIFPEIATRSRMRWAGLKAEEFEFFTTYEKSIHCKPNPEYYKDVAARLNIRPEECLMVGNDVTEDMVAETLGMKVFLLTDCLINKEEKDISVYPNGGFEELAAYVAGLNAQQ